MPWVAWLDGNRQTPEGGFPSRARAMNSFYKPYYRPGKAEVVNPRTGETWTRRFGTWIRTAAAHAHEAGPGPGGK